MPASSQRDYAVQLYTFKEGVSTFDVTFKSETTNEYLFYELSVKSTPSAVIDSIPLSSPVRQPLSYTVTLENPLMSTVAFAQSCVYIEGGKGSCSEIHGTSSFKVPGKSSFEYTFEYTPLKERTTTARLSLSSQDLGLFQYDLILTGTSAGPLPTEKFSSALGETVTRRVRFTNFCNVRTEYAISFEGEQDFSAAATINAPPAVKSGSDVSIDVTYEPSKLGTSRALMLLSSTQGGDYSCPLFGQCTSPKPLGPYTIKPGGKTVIPFRNVFRSTETFNLVCDNPLFSVVKPSENMKSKETKDLIVRYEGAGASKDLEQQQQQLCKMGKLTITCPSQAITWVVYLKGAN